jgi:hypothetical protein
VSSCLDLPERGYGKIAERQKKIEGMDFFLEGHEKATGAHQAVYAVSYLLLLSSSLAEWAFDVIEDPPDPQ